MLQCGISSALLTKLGIGGAHRKRANHHLTALNPESKCEEKMEIKVFIAWNDDGETLCNACVRHLEAEPLSEDDFAYDKIVTCDHCGKRIK